MSKESKGKSNLIIIVLAVVAVVAVGLLAFLPKSASAGKLTEQLNLGEKYLSELNYEQAVLAYNAAIEIDPKNVDAYVGLAEAYLAQGEYDKAEVVLNQAVQEIGENEEIEKIKNRVEAAKAAETSVANQPVATEVPTPTPNPIEEPTATATPIQAVEPTAEPTATPTSEPTVTLTPTPTPTNTPTPAPTSTPTPTPEPTTPPRLESTEASFEVEENEDGTVTIVKYSDKEATIVTIPETIGGKKVTGIGSNAFDGFSNLEIDTLDIGGMNLGNNIFTGVTINKLVMSSNVQSASNAGPFDTAMIESLEIREGVTEIHADLFQDCATITELVLPSTLIAIREEAFIRCNQLTNIIFPKNLATLEYKAFEGCSALVIDELNIGGMTLGNNIFTDVTIKKIVMSSNVLNASSAGPFDTAILEALEVKEGVTEIHADLFQDCATITELVLPSTLIAIREEAFKGCNQITNIIFPKSLTTLENKAFDGCSSLVLGELEIGGMTLGNNVFTDATIKKIVMSSNTANVNAAGPFDTALVDAIEIKAGVTKIAYGLFKRCTLLTEVKVPDTVVEIGMEAFQGCTALKAVYLPASITKIANKAFDSVGDAVIHTPAGSVAEQYAVKYGIPYENY